MSRKIGIIAGSLRKEAYSKKLAKTLISLAPSQYELELLDISKLEMFNQDYEDEDKTPESWTEFRNNIKKYDAFIFVTPEYNRSFPAALKNALDVGSRPYGQNLWAGKPAAVFSISIGALGAFGANHHLRQVLVFLDMPTMPQPEVYIGNAMELFDEKGNLVNEDTKKFLQSALDAFLAWTEKHLA